MAKTIKIKTIVTIEQLREYDIEVPGHYPAEITPITLKCITDIEYENLWHRIHTADESVIGEVITDERFDFE